MVSRAAEWPVNLGSGRPYNVDERDILFLEALIQYGQGKRHDADASMRAVAAFNSGPEPSPALLLQLLAADRVGDAALKQNLLTMLRNSEEDPVASWIMDMYNAGSGTDKVVEMPLVLAGGITARTRAGVSEYDIVSALAALAWKE